MISFIIVENTISNYNIRVIGFYTSTSVALTGSPLITFSVIVFKNTFFEYKTIVVV